mmetsp:Transcript_45213/g.57909  ORF Transcript_45213/g.57909 Transcript_45213/m.57909 type:complete len:216 (-) Transcript_45213:54-701(-)
MNTNHIDDKDITTPSSHHEDVGESSKNSKELGIRSSNRTIPKKESEKHCCHCNGLIVITSTNRSHDMRRDDSHNAHSNDPSIWRASALPSKQPKTTCSNSTKPSRHITTHIIETHWMTKKSKYFPETYRNNLHSRIDSGSYRTPKRIPSTIIKPLEKSSPTIIRKVLSCTEVKPRIELMNHKTITFDSKQSDFIRTDNGQSYNVEPNSPGHDLWQ